MEMKRGFALNNAGAWMGLVILIFAGTIFYQSLCLNYYGNYGPGPGFFARWLSGLLVFFTVFHIIATLHGAKITFNDVLPQGRGLRKVLVIFVALLLFWAVIPYTGYTLASMAMLMILFHGEYKWYNVLLFSALVTLTIFCVFNYFLSVPLPVNAFGF